jgi:hypothetical protein
MGLAGVLRKHYPRGLLFLAVLGLVIANTINPPKGHPAPTSGRLPPP